MRTWHAFTAAAAISVAACSVDAGLFSEGEAVGSEDGSSSSSGSGTGSGSGSGSQQSSSSSGPSSSSATTTSSSSTGGNGGGATAGSGGSGGGTGGAPVCAHDTCNEGVALDSTCNDCATAICNEDPYCCTDAWDYLCTYRVVEICQKDCNPALPSCETQHQNNQNVDELCGENGEVCSVAYGGTSCSAVCFDAGTDCLGVYDNVPSTTCEQDDPIGCNIVPQSAVCICSRGCGNGPPCSTGQFCSAGQCF